MKIVRQLRGSPYTIALVLVVALLLMVISETAYYQAIRSLDRIGRMAGTRLDNVQLTASMTEAETAQRGYLLTGREDYLRSYRSARDLVRSLLDDIETAYRNDAQQRATLAELRLQAQRKLSELDTSIDLKASGKADAALQLMFNDIGKSAMDDIRVSSRALLEHEVQRIVTERASVYGTLKLSRIGVGTLTALSVIAMLLYLRQSRTLARQQLAQQSAVQAERDLLEQQVRERTQHLTELARHLETAREDERSRLARDLHDELGALLTAAKLDAARLKSRLPDISDEAAARLKHLNDTLNSGIALKRRIIEDLRPSSLSNLGLVAALQILGREFAERSGLEVRVEVEPVDLSPASELTVYRLVQEATTNIAKHAKAREVVVTLRAVGNCAEVAVRDDGVGFDARAPRTAAHGLLGMHYRVESEGGALRLNAVPGEGTEVSATLPLRSADLAEAPHPPLGTAAGTPFAKSCSTNLRS